MQAGCCTVVLCNVPGILSILLCMVTSLSEHNASLAIIFGVVGASREVLKQRGWTNENKMG